jgi:hypothetical protein
MRRLVACSGLLAVVISFALAVPGGPPPLNADAKFGMPTALPLVAQTTPAVRAGRVPAPRELKVAVADFAGEKPDPIHGPASEALVQAHGLGDLITDRQDRVERGHRVLKDHGDLSATIRAHLTL